MFFVRHIVSLLLLLFIYHSAIAKEKEIKGNTEVSVNIATLYTGIPELQIGYFFKSYAGVDIGLVASGGYHLYPYQSFNKKLGLKNVRSLKGSYYRFGIKGRYPVTPRNITHALWFQIMGVYTNYRERYYDKRDSLLKGSSASGIGFSVATGADFMFAKHFDLRLGTQYGIAPKFSNKISEFTPGFGWTNLPIQLIIGVNFRFF